MIAKAEQHAFNATGRQWEAWELLHQLETLELLYGGAKGGGKSRFGCEWVFARCLEIIDDFGLKSSKNPPAVGWMGRKQSVDFTKTTLETWKSCIPTSQYEIHEQAKEIIVRGTVKMMFGGLDRREDVRKFNSAEFMLVFFDQAEEVTEADIGELRGSLRMTLAPAGAADSDARWRPPALGYKTLFTANPRDCWLRKEFVDGRESGRHFVPALPSDNPHLPDNYAETLGRAFKHRPELVEAYLYGNWDVFEADDAIIRRVWIREAAKRSRRIQYPRTLVVCDVARFGDDETVIFDMEETEITAEEVYGQKATTYTAQRLFLRQKALGGCLVVVDDTGVGGGVTDQLREMGVSVLAFNGAEASDDPDTYYNLRAQAWWEAGLGYSNGDICQNREDEELAADLTAPRYDFRNGRILVEAKKDIKERLKRSPGRGDAYVMGYYGLRRAWSPEKRALDKKARGRRRYESVPEAAMDPMAM